MVGESVGKWYVVGGLVGRWSEVSIKPCITSCKELTNREELFQFIPKNLLLLL